MVKGEIGHHEQFHLWPQSFQNSSAAIAQNVSAGVKGLKQAFLSRRFFFMYMILISSEISVIHIYVYIYILSFQKCMNALQQVKARHVSFIFLINARN